MWVPARRVRVTGVQLVEVPRSGRLASQTNARPHASVERYTIEPASLLCIRAEMPTTNDDWTVETVLQYRCQYGVEQWQNYSIDRNTWEPWEHLLTAEVQAEARRVRTAALPRDVGGLGKMVVVTLKAALEERGPETVGAKAVLVARLLKELIGPM
uniref:SAP domain-containing protein n=1 Tax=Coccolithus braarudii TaxID=221442 RepID=A0A7S0LKV4_9EUKA|mmetsp:Transcript_41040/g.87564  ORF Transcript_41040/g.87564 Transcript_41040/m.87564 type:complete len:156 (+) Transcript_41040:407-874(+)